MTVVSLAEVKAAREPHITGDAQCIGCQHKWIAVAPVGSDQLDCPACGMNKGRFVNPIMAGDEVWTCACGNDLFRISPKWGPYCTNCASPQSGWFK